LANFSISLEIRRRCASGRHLLLRRQEAADVQVVREHAGGVLIGRHADADRLTGDIDRAQPGDAVARQPGIRSTSS
jgi:hypothetical protein